MSVRKETDGAAISVTGCKFPPTPEGIAAANRIKTTVIQKSPGRQQEPAVTPSSAARMLFSPSLKPPVSPTPFTQGHLELTQLTLLEQISNKRAAAAAAAQELKILEDAAMDAGILPPTTSAAAQPTPTSAQGTEQTSHPTAAKPQLHLTAQEPALYPQAPPAARAAVVFTHATADQKPGQHQSLAGKQPDQHTTNAAAEPQLQTAA